MLLRRLLIRLVSLKITPCLVVYEATLLLRHLRYGQ